MHIFCTEQCTSTYHKKFSDVCTVCVPGINSQEGPMTIYEHVSSISPRTIRGGFVLCKQSEVRHKAQKLKCAMAASKSKKLDLLSLARQCCWETCPNNVGHLTSCCRSYMVVTITVRDENAEQHKTKRRRNQSEDQVTQQLNEYQCSHTFQ